MRKRVKNENNTTQHNTYKSRRCDASSAHISFILLEVSVLFSQVNQASIGINDTTVVALSAETTVWRSAQIQTRATIQVLILTNATLIIERIASFVMRVSAETIANSDPITFDDGISTNNGG